MTLYAVRTLNTILLVEVSHKQGHKNGPVLQYSNIMDCLSELQAVEPGFDKNV